MTQEVQVTVKLTLSCDITLERSDIKDMVVNHCVRFYDKGVDVESVSVEDIKEEKEIYGNI